MSNSDITVRIFCDHNALFDLSSQMDAIVKERQEEKNIRASKP